jgi:hypothetical protein
MDQFSTPQHYEPPPPPHDFAAPHVHAGNGAHPPFDGFNEPSLMQSHQAPMSDHDLPGLPPAHEAPFEPNPLVAALAQDPLPPLPVPPLPLQSLFAPAQHSQPLRAAAPPRLRAGTNGSSNGSSNGATNGAKPAARRTTPDFSGLPPAMAESLAKLAGMPWPPPADGAAPDDARDIEEQAAASIPGTPRREG